MELKIKKEIKKELFLNIIKKENEKRFWSRFCLAEGKGKSWANPLQSVYNNLRS